jgi:RNA polymerase sigma-70 factor (ECF subfamily)
MVSAQTSRASQPVDVLMQTEGPANLCSPPDLEQLMIGYQKADVLAMTALVELLSVQLYRFFAVHTGSVSDANDMLQQVWLHIHRARHTYREGEPVIAWVYAIARRVCMDNNHKRDRAGTRHVVAGAKPGAPAEDSKVGTLPSFDAIVAALPANQSELLILLKVTGLTHEEIARATASTVRAVKQKIHRAYQRLLDLLEADANNWASR